MAGGTATRSTKPSWMAASLIIKKLSPRITPPSITKFRSKPDNAGTHKPRPDRRMSRRTPVVDRVMTTARAGRTRGLVKLAPAPPNKPQNTERIRMKSRFRHQFFIIKVLLPNGYSLWRLGDAG